MPFKKPTTITKLAAIYEAKIKDTQTKNTGTAPDLDTNFTVEAVNKTVKAKKAEVQNKLEYKDAPLMTLRALLPDSLDDGAQIDIEYPDHTKNLDCTFRAEKVEFVIMTCKNDTPQAEWELSLIHI